MLARKNLERRRQMKPWRPSSPNASLPKIGSSGDAYRFPNQLLVPQTISSRVARNRLDALSLYDHNCPKPVDLTKNNSTVVLSEFADGGISRESVKRDSPSNSSRFEQVLFKFANMVVIEGRKAVEDATATANEFFDSESQRLSQVHSEALREKESLIRQLTRELEESRKRSKTLTAHLMRMSSRLSHGSHFPFTITQTFHLWRSKISPVANTERAKFLARLLYRWRIGSLNDSWKRKRAAALRTQSDQHQSAIQSFENEKVSLKSEIHSLESKLREEVTKRESFQSQLKRFVDNTLDDTRPRSARIPPPPPLVSHACKFSNRPARSRSCKPM